MKKLLILTLLGLFTLQNSFAQINTQPFYKTKRYKGNDNRGYRAMTEDSTGLEYFYFYDRDFDIFQPITGAYFETTGDFADNGLAFAKKDGKYGYVDTLGQTVIPFKYDNATEFSDGMAIVFFECKTGIIDAKGNLTMLPKEYEQVFSFSSGRAVVVHKNLSGAIDKNGNEIITPQYSQIRGFDNGLAVYIDTITNLFGAIDTMGKVIFKPIYWNMQSFYTGYSEVSIPAKYKKHKIYKYGVLKYTGEVIVPVEYSSVRAQYYLSSYDNDNDDDSYSLNDDNPDNNFIIIATQHPHGKNGRHGGLLRLPRRVTKALAFNQNGKLLVQTTKKYIRAIDEKTAYFNFDKNAVVIRANGRLDTLANIKRIDSSYSNMKMDTVLAIYTFDHKQGLIGISGKIILPAAYNSIRRNQGRHFIEARKDKTIEIYNDSTLALVKELNGYSLQEEAFNIKHGDRYYTVNIYKLYSGNWLGLLDEHFNEILPPIYNKISIEGKWIIFKKGGLYGVLDNNLKVIIQPEYSDIDQAGEEYGYYSHYTTTYGQFIVKKDGFTGIIDTAGKVLIAPIYNTIRPTRINWDTYYFAKKDKKWGLLDSAFTVVMDFKFDYLDDIDEYIIATNKHKKALYTTKGKQLTGYNYDYIIESAYGGNRIGVVNKKGAGLIDSTGKEIIPLKFKRLNGRNRYVFCKTKKEMLLYDINGRLLIDDGYRWIASVSEKNTMVAQKDGKEGIITPANQVVIPFIYSSIIDLEEDGVYRLERIENKKRYYGVANYEGKIIIPADYAYNQIDYYRNTIVLTMTDGKRYFYNNKGETVTDCYIDKSIGGN